MERLLRRLDHLPRWPALAIGFAIALPLGMYLAQGSQWVLWAGLALVLLLAFCLALSGEPVLISHETPPEPHETLIVPHKVQLAKGWVAIPAGSFRMGSPKDEKGHWRPERPVHTVRISAFVCMQHQVTRKLYTEVMGEDPGWPEGKADDRPVNQVSWFDAVRFCSALSQQHGLNPCYQVDDDSVTWFRSADGYRLPTEAEWEYAARAGTTTRWSFGDDEKDLDCYAWYEENSGDKPHPVGRLKPNPWALYDVHGNVLEWCWDWFSDYSKQAQEDPSGPDKGETRLMRGGAFVDLPRNLRSADRFRNVPDVRFKDIGFRCVRGPRRQD